MCAPPVVLPALPLPHSGSCAQALWAYLLRLKEAATSIARSSVPSPPPAPSAVAGMGALLAALGDLIAEVPPGPTTVGRYGNAAFREWHARASRALPDLVRHVGVADDADVAEVVDLLSLCWGNTTRLDYGSGHEAAFLVVLFVLSEKVRRRGGTGSGVVMAVGSWPLHGLHAWSLMKFHPPPRSPLGFPYCIGAVGRD